jgi:uncharacterized membrane protein YdjX (TVP38/TMEM64 family)
MSAPKSGSYRLPWGRVLVGGAILLGIAAFYATLPPEETLRALVERIDALGPWAGAVFVLVYAAASVLLLPVWILTVAAGAVFGVVRGTLLVLAGATLGALAAFALARTGLRAWVRRAARAYPSFDTLDAAIAARGGSIVFLVRLTPVFPFVYVNYLFGLTAIPTGIYAIMTILGMTPATIVYVALGASAGAAATGETATWSTARLLMTIAGVLAAVVVAFIVARIATRAVREAASQDGNGTPTGS